MKDSIRKFVLGSTTLMAVGGLGSAANAATTSVSIQAIVLSPIQITANQSLNFGVLTDSGAGGTATIDNTGTRTVGGATSHASRSDSPTEGCATCHP